MPQKKQAQPQGAAGVAAPSFGRTSLAEFSAASSRYENKNLEAIYAVLQQPGAISTLLNAMDTLLEADNAFKAVKRALFYGNPSLPNFGLQKPEPEELRALEMLNPATSKNAMRQLHALIGLVNETTELVAGFFCHWTRVSRPKREDVAGEIGDLLCYLSWLCETVDVPMDVAMQVNMRKLAFRWEGKGTPATGDVLRDKDAEHALIRECLGEYDAGK